MKRGTLRSDVCGGYKIYKNMKRHFKRRKLKQ